MHPTKPGWGRPPADGSRSECLSAFLPLELDRASSTFSVSQYLQVWNVDSSELVLVTGKRP